MRKRTQRALLHFVKSHGVDFVPEIGDAVKHRHQLPGIKLEPLEVEIVSIV
jgi:hypothetical protein